MNGNLRAALIVSLLFGISTGVYEFVLPFYLQAQGVSFKGIGLVFALAGVAVLAARIYMGGLSDRLGRKPLYGYALLVCGMATGLAPLVAGLGWQALLKVLRETAALTRETIHPIVLYEEGDAGFLNRIGKFRGVEFLLQAVGTALAGIMIYGMSVSETAYRISLLVGGGVIVVGALWWQLHFTERRRPTPTRVISLRELVSFDLHPNLRIIALASTIFAFGVQLSHSFYMQLFFAEQFQASEAVVAIIMVIHRFTIGLPMLIVGNLPIKNYRAWYINGYIVQGLTVAVSPFLPHLWWSAGVFLLHDLIGAGIWVPIQSTLIQQFSREETRGLEVGKVLAWSSIGAIAGPLAAGLLAGVDLRLPFCMSGMLMILAAIPLFWLNLRTPAAVAPSTAPASAT